jgi:hypothetical protein
LNYKKRKGQEENKTKKFNQRVHDSIKFSLACILRISILSFSSRASSFFAYSFSWPERYGEVEATLASFIWRSISLIFFLLPVEKFFRHN